MLSLLYLSVAFSNIGLGSKIIPARSIVHRCTISDQSDDFEFIKNMDDLSHAWVLLINKNTDKEGIYMLQVSGKTENYVLGFEKESDAQIFANDLRKSYYSFEPVKWSSEQFKHFCEKSANEIRIVPTGSFLSPPQKNNLIQDDDYELLKIALNNLYSSLPENCDDDDCSTIA